MINDLFKRSYVVVLNGISPHLQIGSGAAKVAPGPKGWALEALLASEPASRVR